MKIIKILNNNAVIVLDHKGQESVAMGRGIGFGKKIDDSIDQDKIESQFLRKKGDLNEFFTEILSEIPPVFFAISEAIINIAHQRLNVKIHDTLFLALSDHINFAVERAKEGYPIKNKMLWEIQNFYPKEFQIALEALNIIEQKTAVTLPEDEAGFIALHIVNATADSDMQKVVESTQIIRDMLNIVKHKIGVQLDESTLDYQRFVTHLRFFAQRMLNRDQVHHDDLDLYDNLDQKLPEAWACALHLASYINSNYQHKLTTDELSFLTIHIERLRKRRAADPRIS
ncbi:BglG family transcription antiterminator LicT [Celerinatantimonas diazotrophica]|uniref:BglG family transcriptional antiterminator n=1 Tax=Celerinatantimonas diazotrophica TaxID=412034 RepID=A0A4R1J8I1_9GAMM|nr:PRD domain-containing protein [Celerinatantimonas diazotrophica]TCK46356.1 BglG family transcriptional antiterminator [Celerinatantimonas diazotrophica]CAG9295270.1 Transcription antiterminator LicT [Celerinatantimonas diazotrophica]